MSVFSISSGSSPFCPTRVRSTTLESKEALLKKIQSGTPITSHRKKIKKEDAPSIGRPEDHNCKVIDENNTRLKVNLRVALAFTRMCISTWLGKTRRGKTDATGTANHCKGSCQQAHASWTPKLEDEGCDQRIQEIPLTGITPRKKKFFILTANLTEEEFKEIDAHREEKEWLTQFFNARISIEDRYCSYRNTHFYRVSNTTFLNPAECNTVDSNIERFLRNSEDEINNRCFKKELSPEDGMGSLVEKSIQFLIETKDAYIGREKDLATFFELNAKIEKIIEEKKSIYVEADNVEAEGLKLISEGKTEEGKKLCASGKDLKSHLNFYPSDPEFKQFLDNIKDLLAARDALQAKFKGIKTFHEINEAREDFSILEALNKAYERAPYFSDDEMGAKDLKSPYDVFLKVVFQLKHNKELKKEEFIKNFEQEALKKYELFRMETEIQLKVYSGIQAEKGTEDMRQLIFGVMKDGNRVQPTDDEIYWQLIEMTARENLTAKKKEKEIKALQEAEEKETFSSETEESKKRKSKKLEFDSNEKFIKI